MISLLALSHANRTLFLRDFLESFEKNTRADTELILCLQACAPSTLDLVRSTRFTHRVVVLVEEENIGLNRYDDLVRQARGELLVDTDDDSLLPNGFEVVFEKVLAHPEYGWIGYTPEGSSILPMPGGGRWDIENEIVVASAVGGGLAATRREVWEKVGGFGVGRTKFDLEDARFERKCLAQGYRCGVLEGRTYVHHGGWDWHIRYGTHLARMDSLHEALLADVISEETYRNLIKEFATTLEV